MSYTYEILESDLGLITRIAWVTTEQPLGISGAARALLTAIPSVGRETEIAMRSEPFKSDPSCAFWLCERKGKATLAVLQWPENAAKAAMRDYHKVIVL